MRTIENVKLKDTMPQSISGDVNVSAMADAIDTLLQREAGRVDVPAFYSRLEQLPGTVLDHLAQQFNVSPWRDYWSVTLKINVIKATIATKRKRGTLAAVKSCLESMGNDVLIVPWYEQTPLGEPGTFRINVTMRDNGLTSADAQEDVQQMLNESKPVSRHYEMIIEQAIEGGVNVCGFIRPLVYTKLCNF